MSFKVFSLVLSTSMDVTAATAAAHSPIQDSQSQARELLTAHVEFQSPIRPASPGQSFGGSGSGRPDAQERAARLLIGRSGNL